MPDQQRTFGEEVGLEPILPPADMVPSELEEHSTCTNCGDEAVRDDMHETPDCTNEGGDAGGDIICASCFDALYANCYACEVFVPIEWANGHNDYCCECYDERFTHCSGCDEELSHPEGEVYTDQNGFDGPFCQGCYSERYSQCCQCETEIHRDYTTHNEGGSPHCESCYNDAYVHCTDCGVEVERESAYSSSQGDWFCEGCFGTADSPEYVEGCDCPSCRSRRSRPAPPLSTRPRPFRSQCRDNPDDPTGCSYTSYSWDIEPRPHTHPSEDADFAEIGSRRTFGVEIETSRCNGYMDLQGRTIFGAKRDYSITGREFVSPKLSGDSGLQVITDLCDIARQKNFAINTSCGLHVHFGIADLSLEQRASLVMAYQHTYEVWCAFVPQARVDCRWNKPTYFEDSDARRYTRDERNWESWCNSIDRETWMNICAWMRHKTIESRLHTGSINARKINNWIKANIRFIDTVVTLTLDDVQTTFEGKSRQEKFEYLVDCWGDSDLTAYYLYRSRKFGNALQYDQPRNPLQMSNLELAS